MSRRLVNLIFNIRKHFAGLLLGVIQKVNSNKYIGNGDFVEQYHVASGEEYFYKHVIKKPHQMIILIMMLMILMILF